MTAARPFADRSALLDTAARAWADLDEADWLEAFAAHPKIGERSGSPDSQGRSAEWSRGEQAAAASAAVQTLDALATVNQQYEQRFGFTYIVCATGRSAEEMLDIARTRLGHARDQERITALRLEKLLR
jgi:OHCU decarboxylase